MNRALALALGALLAGSAAAHDGVGHDPNLPAQTKAQIHEVADAVHRYRDFSVLEREGWTRFGGDTPLMGEHWSNPRGPDYVHGDQIDFSRPSNLMYTTIDGERVLTGVAFIVRLGDDEPVPEGFFGEADRWHVHDFEIALEAALRDRPFLRWLANGWIDQNYRNKGDNRARLAMVHAWVTIPNPDGVFADHNRALPYLKLGLPAEWANGASMEAARGLDLATPNGCAEAVDGPVWIAHTGAAVADRLRAACRAAADHVREGLSSGDPGRINAMGEHGWAMFQAAWNRELTDEQKSRIAALTEHGEHSGHDVPSRDHAGH